MRAVLFVVGGVPIELVNRGLHIYALHAHGKPLRLSGFVRVEFAGSYIRVHQIDGEVGLLEVLAEHPAARAGGTPMVHAGRRARFELDKEVSAAIYNTRGYTHVTGFVEVDLDARTVRIELEDYVDV